MTLFAPYIMLFMTRVRGMTAHQYGILQAAYYVAGVLLELPTGVAADRFGRRAALAAGALATGAGCALCAVAHDFWVFLAAEVVLAVATAFVNGADSAMLFDTLAAEGREREYARRDGLSVAAWLFATAIGMPLADRFLVRAGDPVAAYWATTAATLVAALLVLAMREPPMTARLSAREITVGAFADVARQPGVFRMVLYGTGVFMLLRAAMVNFYYPVLDRNGVAPDQFGKILAAVNVFGAGAAYFTHRALHRFGETACLIVQPAALVAMNLTLMVWHSPLAATLFLLQGAVFGTYPLLVNTALNRRVPSAERRATVLSIQSMACRLAFAVVTPLAGLLLERFGLSTAIAATTAASCIPFLLLLTTR